MAPKIAKNRAEHTESDADENQDKFWEKFRHS
jgi:hypothetical protein